MKNNIQVVYGVLLLIVIPGALVLNTLLFFDRARNVMDIELLRKAELADSVFSTEVPSLLADQAALQAKVEMVAASTDELQSLDVLIPDGTAFTIIASLDAGVIGQKTDKIYNTLAWQTKESKAFYTSSNARSTKDESVMSNERFWVVVKPVIDASGTPVALSSIKLSSKVIDELSQQMFNRSVLILIGSIIVIILLLLNNTRLFQYAALANKLREVDQMKDEFISMTSHELRAPITGIRGYLAMLEDGSFGSLPVDAHAKVKLVLDETNRLRDLVEDLLDVSRIEQGRIKLDIIPVSVASVIDGVTASFKAQAAAKGLVFSADIQDRNIKVMADSNKLTQVMVNLASNAVKYTIKGSVVISAEQVQDKRPMVKIKITDTGMGMSAKNRERLFQKFYRIRNEQTDKIIGTGLGLWITKALVTNMKGEIYVDSIEGKGTEFTVLLPAAPKNTKG
ncbi:MAG: HAMP domain-containing sensor histidine kinase [Patescibacteria group bacterium]